MVKVLAKALALLDVLARVPDLSVVELSEITGEPRRCVYRIMGTLQKHGFVEKGSVPRTYRLGTRMLLMGHAVSERLTERNDALVPMR